MLLMSKISKFEQLYKVQTVGRDVMETLILWKHLKKDDSLHCRFVNTISA